MEDAVGNALDSALRNRKPLAIEGAGRPIGTRQNGTISRGGRREDAHLRADCTSNFVTRRLSLLFIAVILSMHWEAANVQVVDSFF